MANNKSTFSASSSLLASIVNQTSQNGVSSKGSNPSSDLLRLATTTASGGLASAFGGGLSGIGGIGSLISGIVNLFGGSDAAPVPALVKFELPEAINETVYASGSGLQSYAGNVVEPVAQSDRGNGPGNSAVQPLRYRSGEIAQAVKQALLHSSTLSDVIAEI